VDWLDCLNDGQFRAEIPPNQGPWATVIWRMGVSVSFGVNADGDGKIIVRSFTSCFK
jgi:hypothetical protein